VAAGAGATAAPLSSGADVIYRGVLTRAPDGGHPALLGFPDFLVAAPDGEPQPDGARYEVVDAKLARSAKGRAVAQAAFYSQLRPSWIDMSELPEIPLIEA
jgi:predicted RecB family nuclease